MLQLRMCTQQCYWNPAMKVRAMPLICRDVEREYRYGRSERH